MGDKITLVDGSSTIDSTGIDIVFKGNYSIYNRPKIIYSDNTIKARNDTIDIHFDNPDTIFRYFVIKKGEKFGIVYESESYKIGMPFSLDSLLKEMGIHSSMKEVYNLNLGKPNIITKERSGITVEKYLNTKKTKEDPDSIYRYFDKKLVKIDFSFSPFLDKERQSKLFKTSFINLYKVEGDGKQIKRAEFYTEMKELQIKNPKLLLQLVNQYERDKKSLNMK